MSVVGSVGLAVTTLLCSVTVLFASSPGSPPTPAPTSQAEARWVFPHAKVISGTGALLQGADLGAVAEMRVAIDPETGALRPPTPEELKALEPQTKAVTRLSVSSSAELALPDGTIMMPLDPDLMNFSLGSSSGITCSEGSHGAVEAPAAPARKEK